ncbi:hypothetical protein [Acidiplasma sp.]|uniref:hypothetical protein n=1 Tax=Acidiplasma sp. TaxID=1872114 RepID=UPI0025847EEF|nr:hypothetical protein [Acidiplasma sp.]
MNWKTVNAYNINDNDVAVCKVMTIFEKRIHYESGNRNNVYSLVAKVNKDFEFEVFSYTNMVGGRMYALKISRSFVESVGIREGDYMEFNLLLLKKGEEVIPIYPESERLGDKPYDFNDSDYGFR